MKQAPLFGIRLEERARKALDDAILIWPDIERHWEAIEWAAVHDELIGTRLFESGSLRSFVYAGARSIGCPDIQVILETHPDQIIIHEAIFTEAKSAQSGTG